LWHVSSRSGVATLQTAIHLILTYLLTSDLNMMLSIAICRSRPGCSKPAAHRCCLLAGQTDTVPLHRRLPLKAGSINERLERCDIIQMMHGSEWTLKYDEPEVQNVHRTQPECDIFNRGSSYFNVARTTVLHMFCRLAKH